MKHALACICYRNWDWVPEVACLLLQVLLPS